MKTRRPQVAEVARTLHARGYEAVAIAYLFSHQNPDHERRPAAVVRREAPGLYVSVSADIAPVQGEYERSATALFNGYVGPVIDRYLARLERSLADAGLRQKLLIVQANGGLATVAQTVPICTIESGPAAGVVGAAQVAARLGHRDLIATDVGGTTFKVAVIQDGMWSHSSQTVLNQYQLRLPMIDVASIGAGGGSIAWVDGRRLRIGPRSASARPGPACYGQGGTEPTVTDADVVLGYISPERFLGGRMRLHADRAREAIRTRIAEPLFGGDVIAAAAGIRRVVDSQMADLIRKSTLERGHDPRHFAMMAYGGAGPVHAASYGREAGCTQLVIPFFATVHSAYGAALSDIRFSLQFSEPIVLHDDPTRIEQIFADMEARGRRALAEADVPAGAQTLHRWVEARYRRQVHQLRVPVPARVDVAALKTIAEAFEHEYERLFGAGSGLSDAGVELINYGVDAVGAIDKPRWEAAEPGTAPPPTAMRAAYCPIRGTMIDTPVHDGPRLPPGTTITGPAIIEHPGTTIVVLTGQTARIDDWRHTHIAIGGEDAATASAGEARGR
ncbi:MAG TPA: hydantoinase/oxoprolinase family protein [Burkholderiaceae bacterium]|nr:hydantoinase/oxoprolinase family protein [Burkholderiaceae bacterium]